ncbi:hypothetical protein BC629DRAFT_1562175 [Irpex lacteus]|nr:hypothetical protein BC629DRAFT_1562175 [Irpex lacteus]
MFVAPFAPDTGRSKSKLPCFVRFVFTTCVMTLYSSCYGHYHHSQSSVLDQELHVPLFETFVLAPLQSETPPFAASSLGFGVGLFTTTLCLSLSRSWTGASTGTCSLSFPFSLLRSRVEVAVEVDVEGFGGTGGGGVSRDIEGSPPPPPPPPTVERVECPPALDPTPIEMATTVVV